MKKILFNILPLVILILIGCNDFLELTPANYLNEGNAFKNEKDLTMAVNAAYIKMRDDAKSYYWVMMEMRSDNTTFQYDNEDRGYLHKEEMDEFLESSTAETILYVWEDAYSGIGRCNTVLEKIDDIEFETGGLKDQLIGEAKFLRAFYYFYMVRLYGGVPIVDHTITANDAVGIDRASVNEVYEFIVNDLKDAIAKLPKEEFGENVGRATIGAAQTMLGEVYLTSRSFSDAEKVLAEVYNSGTYELLDVYADVFSNSDEKKNHKESIFAIQYQDDVPELASNFIFTFAPWTSGGDVTGLPSVNIRGSGSGWNMPTQDLLDLFDSEGDVIRKDASVGAWNGTDWDGNIRDVWYCKKYKQPRMGITSSYCNDNFTIYRFSDVILMYAEALNENGNTSEAYIKLNEVRDRVNLSDKSGNKDQFRIDVEIERRLELCFENHRWFDLLRSPFGTTYAIDVMNTHGEKELAIAYKTHYTPSCFKVTANDLLFPIPNREVLYEKIEQNPGY